MGVQSLPQYKELSEETDRRTVVVEQGEKGELKATLTPATGDPEKQVSGYPVTPPVAGQIADEQSDDIYPVQDAQAPLPCGCGLMWTIFFVGWIFGGMFTWWAGVCIGVFVSRQDQREKPGFMANLIAAFISTVFFLIYVLPRVEDLQEYMDYYNEGSLQCEQTCYFENYSRVCTTICN